MRFCSLFKFKQTLSLSWRIPNLLKISKYFFRNYIFSYKWAISWAIVKAVANPLSRTTAQFDVKLHIVPNSVKPNVLHLPSVKFFARLLHNRILQTNKKTLRKNKIGLTSTESKEQLHHTFLGYCNLFAIDRIDWEYQQHHPLWHLNLVLIRLISQPRF